MGSAKKQIHTEAAPGAVGPYSQAIEAGGMLFVSGQLPIAPETGEFVEGDIAARARQTLRNAGAVLEAAGMGFEDVVKATVFLTDMSDFQAMNGVYAEFFTKPYPARSVIEVAALPKGANVEMEFIAVKA